MGATQRIDPVDSYKSVQEAKRIRPQAFTGPQPAVCAPAADYEVCPPFGPVKDLVWKETTWSQKPHKLPKWSFPPTRSKRFEKPSFSDAPPPGTYTVHGGCFGSV